MIVKGLAQERDGSAAESKYLYSNLTYKIIGLTMEIHRELGPVHKETIYQRALEKSLRLNGINFKREEAVEVIFKGEKVGLYRPDFVVEDKIVVELKALPFLPIKSSIQLTYYLKNTDYRIGLLINFGGPSLQVKRRIYDKSRANK